MNGIVKWVPYNTESVNAENSQLDQLQLSQIAADFEGEIICIEEQEELQAQQESLERQTARLALQAEENAKQNAAQPQPEEGVIDVDEEADARAQKRQRNTEPHTYTNEEIETLQGNEAYDAYEREIEEAFQNVSDASNFGATNPFFQMEQADTGGQDWDELEAEAVCADAQRSHFTSSLVEDEAEEEF